MAQRKCTGISKGHHLPYQYARHIEFLNDEIMNLEKEIASEAAKEEYVAILMSMSGIDYYSAMLIASEIGDISRFDISRFATPKKLVSWAGLCPTLHQSGNSSYHGTIKHGNKKVQTIMIQAANTAARTDQRMRQLYLRVAKKHGHNVAITHVANKMMIIIWHMITHKKLYNERKEELYRKKLKKIGSTY
jgi:transposase